MHVVAVGECTIDRYAHQGVAAVGGISLNFAMSALVAGADRVSLVSCLGDDEEGALVERFVARTSLDGAHLARAHGRTATQRILLDARGERTFPAGGYDPGVLANFALDSDALAILAHADVVAIPVFAQLLAFVQPIIDNRSLGTFRVADLLDGADLGTSLEGVEPLVDAFDVLFVSGDERTVKRLAPLTERRDTRIVVTLGAAGSCVLVRGARHDAPAVPLAPNELRDTTGCGDAFQGTFTVHFMQHRDIRAALDAGAHAAARVATHIGALTCYESSLASI